MAGCRLTRIMKLPIAARLTTTGCPARGRSARRRLSVWIQTAPSSSVTIQWPRPSCDAEATTPSNLVDLVVVAAAENGQPRQSDAEQPAPALADLGAVHDHDVAAFRRRLQCGRRLVEAAQPGRILRERAAAEQRLERLGARLAGLDLRRSGGGQRRQLRPERISE